MHNALVEACGTPLTRIGLRARDRTSHKRLGKQTTTRHGSSCSQPSSTTSGSPKVQPKGQKPTRPKPKGHSPPGRPGVARWPVLSRMRKRGNAIGPLDPTRPSGGAPLHHAHATLQPKQTRQRNAAAAHAKRQKHSLVSSSPPRSPKRLPYSASAIPQPRKEADAHQRDRTTPPVRRDPAGPEASSPPPPVLPPPHSRRRRTLAPPRVPQGRDRRRWTGAR